MKRIFLSTAFALLLTLLALGRSGMKPLDSGDRDIQEAAGSESLPAALAAEKNLATPVLEEEREPQASRFFPKARVVAHVEDPAAADGSQRVIETLETTMRQRFVRLERTFVRGSDGKRLARNEVAMVANQLLLQRPESVDTATFAARLREAGATDVKDLGSDAVLATFEARPEDPRALDSYLSRVREVAGAEITVEPNYIRKLF